MEPKRESMLIKSLSTGTGLGRPEQLHPEMQQTAVDGILLADGTSRELGGTFSFQADFGTITKKITS